VFYAKSVESWIVPSDYSDTASARTALDRQEIGVVVIIPQDFSEHILAGENDIQVLIISDRMLTVAPQVVQNMVRAVLDGVIGGGIAFQVISERQQEFGLQPDSVLKQTLISHYATWYAGFQQDSFHHPDRAALVMVDPPTSGISERPAQPVLGIMMAGQMAFFAFFTGAYSMMSILREEEEGTLARLFTTPVGRASILAGKFCSVFLAVTVQGIVLIAATHYAFAINWGEPLAVLLALIGQVIAAAGLGVLLISFAKTTQQAGPLLGGGLTVLGVLGGLLTVGMNMPEAFTRLAIFTPQGWVIKTWNAVLGGQSALDLIIPFIVLTVMGITMFTLGARVFRRRLVN